MSNVAMYGTTSTVQIEIVDKMLLVSVTQPNVGSSLAQLVERETVNLEVVSSILTGRDSFCWSRWDHLGSWVCG